MKSTLILLFVVKDIIMNTSLIRKYNVPGPRYTSYPTVPYWDASSFSSDKWQSQVQEAFADDTAQPISLYIHLPYCESLCTYCGCNTRITVNHRVEQPYIAALLKEWDQYLALLKTRPNIREIHLGGGTPTFFSPENLSHLVKGILSKASLIDGAELSFEAHPNNTSREHLETLFQLGFRRLSFGIQDFDPEVQKTIHRIQPFERVREITELAKSIGYTSVNFDLIFGLPKQTEASIRDTIYKTAQLRPDRIAFYSYAHVPWIKPAQRSFEKFLPSQEEKRNLYETGKQLLEQHGYCEIGMDHFALSSDRLYQASQAGTLHRNFMGYNTQGTRMLIGLGASAISDVWTAFSQNAPSVDAYLQQVEANQFPVNKGHVLNSEDLLVRKHILNLMCKGATYWNPYDPNNQLLTEATERLQELEQDGIVLLSRNAIRVTEAGKPFIRNVCMALDVRMWRKKSETALFSQTI